jgi:hypothetical protein
VEEARLLDFRLMEAALDITLPFICGGSISCVLPALYAAGTLQPY